MLASIADWFVEHAVPASLAAIVAAIVVAMLSPLGRRMLSRARSWLTAKRHHPGILGPEGIDFIDRKQFTPILVDRLQDPSTSKVEMIVYTGEVDAGLLQKLTGGGTQVEVFKRSIVADLAEEQETNLKRIAQGIGVRLWKKRRKSVLASENIENARADGFEVVQHFYDTPPFRRAYVFDDREALVAFYETVDLADGRGGSLYKGVSGAHDALHASTKGRAGRHVLRELESHIGALKIAARDWKLERAMLDGTTGCHWVPKPPVLDLKAVLLDLDGVLYDSLEHYKKSWQAAFENIAGIDLPASRVYEEEGRSGPETIRRVLKEAGVEATSDLVERIYAEKRREFGRLPPPAPMVDAEKLVRSIDGSDLSMCVVTGSSREDLGSRLKNDFSGLLGDRLVRGDDVSRGKPDPAPYLAACERLGVEPSNALVVENAPLGIESACRAGIFCIAINSGMLSDEALYRAGARVVFRSCRQLANVWRSVADVFRS